MNKRLGYALVLAAAVGGLSVSACSDDDAGGDGDAGGSSGSASGGKSGGNSGGSSNKAGTHNGGEAGAAPAEAGAGGAAEGGTGGAGEGGATQAGAGGDAAGGAGGAGEQPLVYACGSGNTFQKLCSAFKAANCADPTDCSDCTTAWTADDEGYRTTCATCNALVDAFYQCGVDAFESGNLASGVECVDGFGGDMTIECYDKFTPASDCQGYILANDCPATWPPPQ